MSKPRNASDGQTTIPLELARSYHDAWTSQDLQEARRYLAADLETDVPLNTYANAAQFLEGLSGFVQLVTDVNLLAEFGDNEEAMLLYDVNVEPIGRLRVAEHFTVVDRQITRIRHVHDTAALRAAGLVGEA
jgi:hypothetical protein